MISVLIMRDSHLSMSSSQSVFLPSIISLVIVASHHVISDAGSGYVSNIIFKMMPVSNIDK